MTMINVFERTGASKHTRILPNEVTYSIYRPLSEKYKYEDQGHIGIGNDIMRKAGLKAGDYILPMYDTEMQVMELRVTPKGYLVRRVSGHRCEITFNFKKTYGLPDPENKIVFNDVIVRGDKTIVLMFKGKT